MSLSDKERNTVRKVRREGGRERERESITSPH